MGEFNNLRENQKGQLKNRKVSMHVRKPALMLKKLRIYVKSSCAAKSILCVLIFVWKGNKLCTSHRIREEK